MIKTSIGGAAIIALCCVGPALVPLLGALSLSAWLSWAGYALLPALAAMVAVAAVGVFYLRRRSGADTAGCGAESSSHMGYSDDKHDTRLLRPAREDRGRTV
ncbi:MAG: mercury resistance system transport protein MerF [Rhodospirillales bacterium]|nr:mercury resistance system transport protein MerF [Rhodospirillales bacterium]